MTMRRFKNICLKHFFIFIVKLLLLTVLLWFVGKALLKAVSQIEWAVVTLNPGVILSGFLMILCSVFVGIFGLKYIYEKFEEASLSFFQAFSLLSVPPLGKYLPSKFFAFAGYVVIAKTFGIRMTVSASVAFLLMGLGLISATLIGTISLTILLPNTMYNSNIQIGLAAMIAVICIIFMYPGIYWSVMNFTLRFFRQSELVVKINRHTFIVLFVLLLLQNGFYLLGVSTIAGGIMVLSVTEILTLTGVTCLANVIGFLAVFAPAGIGVREGVFLLLLSPVIGTGEAGLIAVMMRIIQTVSDGIMGLAGFAVLQRVRNN